MAYIKFGNYEPEREIIISDKENGNSMQHSYIFPNGYGVIVVQNEHSRGHEDGRYEVFVVNDDELCYNTPIICDVGYLTADEVAEHISRIERLPDLKEKRKEGSKLCNTQKPYTK